MAYLVDANCLIQAKNDYYDFHFHPGFWDWLIRENGQKKVYSIDRIFQELDNGLDTCPLKIWAKVQKATFFLPFDAKAAAAMTTVANWVNAGAFKVAAKKDFLACADPFLIAYALAHSHTVVSHEVHKPGEKKKVKVPTVCIGLGVKCIRTSDMLKQENASFVLAP